MRCTVRRAVAILIILSCVCLAQEAAPNRLRFEVTISHTLGSKPVSGRLIVLLSKKKSDDGFLSPGFGIDARTTWITAREVDSILPGHPVTVDPDESAFPSAFSKAPAGDYYAMAMLDVNHDAAYRFFTPGDLRMKAVWLGSLDPHTAGRVRLTLNLRMPKDEKLQLPKGMEWIDFASPLLSRFYGRPIHMRGVVVLPPSYGSSSGTYPTVYLTPGFGARAEDLPTYFGEAISREMSDQAAPEMIYVLLDESLSTGTHEFADSVNNGPWGAALTTELIPYLELKYRMDARPSGRLLTGHSSGGWATLWLQITYPDLFGGTWSTSPDPVDFRDFVGPDLADAKPGSNAYVKPDGSLWMMVRMKGKDVESTRDYSQQESVLGDYGGQMSSFEWVFSPRGEDGRPMRLFDRVTGEINPAVAAAWENYDISRILRENWAVLGPKLKGKIHIFVGTADTFHLESSVRLLDDELKKLGAEAQIVYLPDRTHFDLYEDGLGLRIADEMYRIARHATKEKH